MKQILGVLFWFVVLGAASVGAEDTPFYDKVSADEYSPRSDMLVEHYFERNGTDQIWLVSSADPSKRRLLFTHERHATVLFSDDERWLVINNHLLSNESRLLLYRQKAPLEYEQVADLTEATWQFFDQQNKPVGSNRFDHRYVEVLRWSDADPPTLLLELSGHADSRHHTGSWYCFYDLRTKTFSTDLAAHNKKVTQLPSE